MTTYYDFLKWCCCWKRYDEKENDKPMTEMPKITNDDSQPEQQYNPINYNTKQVDIINDYLDKV